MVQWVEVLHRALEQVAALEATFGVHVPIEKADEHWIWNDNAQNEAGLADVDTMLIDELENSLWEDSAEPATDPMLLILLESASL